MYVPDIPSNLSLVVANVQNHIRIIGVCLGCLHFTVDNKQSTHAELNDLQLPYMYLH